VTEAIEMDGAAVTLIDTAGLHGSAADIVEQEGIARAHSARKVADVVVVVLDRSRPLTEDDRTLLAATSDSRRVVVGNKSDLTPAWALGIDGADAIAVSAKDGSGIEALRRSITSALGGGERRRDAPAITNARHIDLLSKAASALGRAAEAAARGTPEEFVTADVTEARALLEEVTGLRTPDDVLHAIFSKFCIGK
jgi:tRNA modification GTPase